MSTYNVERKPRPIVEDIVIQAADYPRPGRRAVVTLHIEDMGLKSLEITLHKSNGNRNTLHVDPHELDNLVEAVTMAQNLVHQNLARP